MYYFNLNNEYGHLVETPSLGFAKLNSGNQISDLNLPVISRTLGVANVVFSYTFYEEKNYKNKYRLSFT